MTSQSLYPNHIRHIRKEDLRLLSYAEFGQLLEILTDKVFAACQERRLRIDAVAPILRSGAFPGCHLASKLGVTGVFPLQYKHTCDADQPLLSRYRGPTLTSGIPDNGVILVADTNTVTGEIAQRAAADIRAELPESRIFFASVMLDVSLEAIPGVDVMVSARRTNERRTVPREAARRAGIWNEVFIFPWENFNEQWSEIRAAQDGRRAHSSHA